jgi:hypothetical protein
MRVKHTKAELTERRQLETLLADPSKSEIERDLYRARLQGIRDAAVTRAKVREACKDVYTEPKTNPEVDAPVTDANDSAQDDHDKPWGERFPFEGYAERFPHSLEMSNDNGYRSWQNLCRFMDEVTRLAKLKETDPEAYEKYWRDGMIAARERAAKLQCINHHGEPVDACGVRQTQTEFIPTYAQKQAWQKQSEQFARQRGNVDAPSKPDTDWTCR